MNHDIQETYKKRTFKTVVLKLKWASESSVGLIKTWIAQPYPRVSKSADPGWSLRVCISSKLPVDAADDDPRTTL